MAARTGPDPGTGRSRTLQKESPFPRKQVRAEETFLPILAVCDLVVRGAFLLEGPFINPQSLWTLRRKHLVDSIAVSIYLHFLTARKGKETGNRGSVHIGLVNGDFQLWEERGKHTKVRVP